MHHEERTRWTKALTTASILFFFFSIYLFMRRGYYTLYIINKVFGSTAAVLAGMVLLVAPATMVFPGATRFLAIRKHMGLLAFFLGSLHMIISLFFLPNSFDLPWYLKELFPIAWGFVAIGLWLYLTSISTNDSIRRLGAATWKKHQSILGQGAFLAIVLHLIILKYQGWIRWSQGQVKASPQLAHPSYPPASLFVLLVVLLVLCIRIVFLLRRRR